MGNYTYTCHIFSGQYHILQIYLDTGLIKLSPFYANRGPDAINFDDLRLGTDFNKIIIEHDEINKRVQLFDEENTPRLWFEYNTHLAFTPVRKD